MIVMDNLHYKNTETSLYKEVEEILKRKTKIYGLQIGEKSVERVFFSGDSDLIEIMETNIPINKIEISKSLDTSRAYFGNDGCSFVYSWDDFAEGKKIVRASCYGGHV